MTLPLYAAHAEAAHYFRAQLRSTHDPSTYLRDRGLGAVVDRDGPWHIGFAANDWTALGDHLRARGFTDTDLLRGGLAFRSQQGRVLDLFRGRIMFPLRDGEGRVVGFTGRIWPPNAQDSRGPKYLNSPDTAIYNKGHLLFGVAEQRDRITSGWAPVLVEGPTDALAIWTTYASPARTGLVALATCGTALTAAQLDIAAGLPGARRFALAVAFDGDDAGRKAAGRAYALLAEQHPDTVARGARFAAGADPGALATTAHGRVQLRATLEHRAQPLLHVVLEDRLDAMLERRPTLLQEVEGQVALGRVLAPLIAEQSPEEARAAIAHITDVTYARLGDAPHRLRDAVDTVHYVTAAVAHYLETTPAPIHPARSAPAPPHPAATAFPFRPLTSTGSAYPPTRQNDFGNAVVVRSRRS